MTDSSGKERLPKVLRQAINLLRRHSSLSLLFGGVPVEPAVTRFYSEYVRNEDVVVEVGARMGDGTRVLAHLAKHVYSFEPARESFFLLRTFTRRHRNVNAYNIALSDHMGEAYLKRDRNFSGVASLKKLSGVSYRTKERVKVVRLDDLKFRLPPTLLVLDCEGSEVEVLRGAERSLPTFRSVLVEIHALEDGSTTLDEVIEELRRFFPNPIVDYARNDCWVLAKK